MRCGTFAFCFVALVGLFCPVHAQEWRAEKVRQSVREAFGGYRAKAWGMDELRPVTGGSNEWLGLGATIVSSLDTLYIMGLKGEFQAGLEWVKEKLNVHSRNDLVSVFETTIRILGGLLGAYELSREGILLVRAIELGDALSPAFTKSPSCIPAASVNLAAGTVDPYLRDTNLAMVGTLQLEFRYLAFVSGRGRFQRMADRALNCTLDWADPNGLFPVHWSPGDGEPLAPYEISLDGGGDSFYEYLIKQYLQTGQTEPRFLRLFERAVEGMKSALYATTTPSKFGYFGRLVWSAGWTDPVVSATWGHLSCFLGGMFTLHESQVNARPPPNVAVEIGRTCYHMYNGLSKTISGEALRAVDGQDFEWTSRHNYLRPEAIETLTYLYWATGDDTYREWAWDMFQRFLNFTRLPDGTFSGLSDFARPKHYDDLQQAYFFSETMKYFYLIFSPPFDNGRLRLDRFVFTTEAHPLRVFSSASPEPDGPDTPRSYPNLFVADTACTSANPFLVPFVVSLVVLAGALVLVVVLLCRARNTANRRTDVQSDEMVLLREPKGESDGDANETAIDIAVSEQD